MTPEGPRPAADAGPPPLVTEDASERQRATATVREPLTGLQLAALSILGIVLALLLLMSALIVWQWITTAPKPPALLTEESLNAYRTLAELHQTRFRELFQSVVVSAFLPLVTLVAGYLFGVRAKNS